MEGLLAAVVAVVVAAVAVLVDTSCNYIYLNSY